MIDQPLDPAPAVAEIATETDESTPPVETTSDEAVPVDETPLQPEPSQWLPDFASSTRTDSKPDRTGVKVWISSHRTLTLMLALALFGIAGIGALTSMESSPTAGSGPAITQVPSPEASPGPSIREAALAVRPRWTVTDRDYLVIGGNADPAALVVIEWSTSKSAQARIRARADRRGVFTAKVTQLALGQTTVSLEAHASGSDPAVTSTIVDRVLSRAAQAKLAEDAKRRYKAGCTFNPSYDSFAKNPDRYAGSCVGWKAKVFQFDARTGTDSLLVYVSDGGCSYFDCWDDLVYLEVDANAADRIDEDDIIRFWGDVVGSYTYDTAIGGSNTVPHVRVRYIELVQKKSD